MIFELEKFRSFYNHHPKEIRLILVIDIVPSMVQFLVLG